MAIVLDGDTLGSLLARADSSLYSTKAAGRSRVYRHDGDRIEAVTGTPWAELPEVPAAAVLVIKETVRNFIPVKL